MSFVITSSILKKIFPPRKKDCHKYDFGHLLVIGGSKLYHGSPLFAALSAYKTGVDLVTIAAPRRSADIIAGYAPDLITYPLDGDFISSRHLKELFKLARGKTAVVIGGGMGKEPQTLDMVNTFLKKIEIPSVIDADAIHAVAQDKSVIKENFVLTPHIREFLALSGKDASKMSLKQKISAVEQSAMYVNATIILKGSTDIISDSCQTALNKTGNPYMTKGGTGDTLAGICGSLLAQGIDPFTAACGAAYINGKAGDLAAKSKKQSFMASDLVDNICLACE